MGRKPPAVTGQFCEQVRVNRIGAAKDRRLLLGDDLVQDPGLATEKTERGWEDRRAVDPRIHRAPESRRVIDHAEIEPAGKFVEARCCQRKYIHQAGSARTVRRVKGRAKGAGRGVVAFAKTGGENEDVSFFHTTTG